MTDDSERLRKRAQAAMTQIGRQLRRRSTNAEATLWEYLRDRNFEGIKFRRQHPIYGTTYVVDFYCHDSRLAIELDGAIHEQLEQQRLDVVRQHDIEAPGICVLRFRNAQVFNDLPAILTTILTTHEQRLDKR